MTWNDKANKLRAKMLVEMGKEMRRPWPIGPFTKRYARLWTTYFAISQISMQLQIEENKRVIAWLGGRAR